MKKTVLTHRSSPLFVMILALLATTTLIGCGRDPTPAPVTATNPGEPPEPGVATEGQLAPSFALDSFTGQNISLRALRGHPVLLNFWASWCGPCRDEMPDLMRVLPAYQDQGLIVLGINEDEKLDDARQFISDLGIDFPVVHDKDSKVMDRYGFRALPTSVFIDSQGIVRAIRPGSMSYPDFSDRLQEALNLRPGRAADQTPQFGAVTLTGCVTATVLNIRKGPGTNYSIAGKLNKGDCRELDARNSDVSWLRIAQSGDLWVAAQYISAQGDVSLLPVVR